jgi:hypothetical protein
VLSLYEIIKILLRVDEHVATKVKVIATLIFLILSELDLEWAWRKDVNSRRTPVLDNQSGLIMFEMK